MKRIVVIALVVLGAGAALAILFVPGLLGPAKTLPLQDTTIRQVAALGRIRPEDGTIDVGADATRRVARLLAEEGQSVKKGEILAYLDNYEEMQAAAAFALAQYEGGKAQLKYRTALEQANIAKAEAELRSVEELTPLDIAIQEFTVEKGRQDLELAQKEAKRLDTLVGKGSASREDLDKKSTEVAQRTIQLKSASEELRRWKGALKLNVAKAQANLDSARANLKYYQANIDLDSLGKSMEQAQARLNTSIVRAPADGTILKIRTRPGEVVRNPGVLTMGKLSTMWVLAEVYENDLPRIKEGQTATVTAAALPEPLSGRVTLVGRLISRQSVVDVDPTAATDARVAEVLVRLDRAEPAARMINLQVTVRIDVEPHADKSQGPAPQAMSAGRMSLTAGSDRAGRNGP
jgi:HlyD family secretion protein